MTVLVTGATGLLGNNVVRLLLEQGRAVRVLARAGCDPRPLDGLNIDIAQGDVRDEQAVARAMQGAAAVVHSAAMVHIGRTGHGQQQAINVGGTRNVARAARQEGAKLVYVSTVDTLGQGSPEEPADEETPPYELPVSCPYVETKRLAEQAVLEGVADGLYAVIVNPGYMLGPWDWKPSSGRMLLSVAGGWTLVAPRGLNSFCDARDVASGIIAAIDRGAAGRRYVLAGTSLTYREAWELFAEVTGGRKPLLTPPGPIAMAVAGRAGDLLARLTGREPDVNSTSVAMARMPRYFSSRRAAEELGYQHRAVRDSAEDSWRWFREYGYAS